MSEEGKIEFTHFETGDIFYILIMKCDKCGIFMNVEEGIDYDAGGNKVRTMDYNCPRCYATEHY